MPDQLINLLVLFAVIAFLLASVIGSPKFRIWFGQKKADRKLQRAHAGKVKCDDPDCDQIATMLTPNGYFCDWHWEPMSKKNLEFGRGIVTWQHPLSHAIRRS